jgi:hypothetical protein
MSLQPFLLINFFHNNKMRYKVSLLYWWDVTEFISQCDFLCCVFQFNSDE